MVSFTLKNIPDRLHRKLRAAARQNRRSLNSEILLRLEADLDSSGVAAETVLTKARALREKMSIHLTEEQLDAFKNKGRA